MSEVNALPAGSIDPYRASYHCPLRYRPVDVSPDLLVDVLSRMSITGIIPFAIYSFAWQRVFKLQPRPSRENVCQVVSDRVLGKGL